MNEPVWPVRLAAEPAGFLTIEWSDGVRHELSLRALRQNCPCATCREKETGRRQKPPGLLPVLTPAEARPLELRSMQPAGNYGYRIAFSDGHGQGIYTLEQLRALGEAAADAVQ